MSQLKRLDKITKILEDRFFYSENSSLIDQLTLIQNKENTITEMSRISGIINKTVLEELLRKNIKPETLAALSLIPIIKIAWADNTIDEKEIKIILACAQKIGITEGIPILSEWLSHKPNNELYEAWETYMAGLCEVLSKECIKELQKEIVEHTEAIAKASGSFLGLTNPISEEEQKILNTISSFFNKPGPCHL